MTKQETFLQLIKDLELPVGDVKAKKLITQLSEHELDDLVEKYQAVLVYEEQIETALVEEDSAVAEKIIERVDDEALKDALQLIDEEEQELNKLEEELDAVELEVEGRFDTILDKQNLDNMRADAQLVALLDDMLKAAKAE
jgi:hypothetical protein